VSKDLLYLTGTSEVLQRITEYTTEGRQAFLGSTLVQDEVIRNLIEISEAVKNLSSNVLKAQRPHLGGQSLGCGMF
jgi:uncharacterized protein with HEPN domain